MNIYLVIDSADVHHSQMYYRIRRLNYAIDSQ